MLCLKSPHLSHELLRRSGCQQDANRQDFAPQCDPRYNCHLTQHAASQCLMPARAPSLFWLRGGSTPAWNHQRQQQLTKYFPKPRGESQCQPWAHQHLSPAPLACQSSVAFLARQARRLIPLSQHLAIGNSDNLELPWQPNTQTGKSKMWEREEYCVTRLMSLHRQLEALQTILFLSAAGKVLPFYRRKSTGNPAGMKYAREMAHRASSEQVPYMMQRWWGPSGGHDRCHREPPAHTRLALCTGQCELLRQPAMLSSACPFPSSCLGEKSIPIQCWHCAQCWVLSSYTEKSPAWKSQGKI